MVKGVSMKLIPALVLTVFSGAASASGFQLFEQNASGIGNAYAGSVITPYYDSLLVKAMTWGLSRKAAIAKMQRGLGEFRIRGVKTNIPFLINVVSHEKFLQGTYDTSFVDSSPELFVFPDRKDRASKLLKYIGNITVNGYEGISRKEKPAFQPPRMPQRHWPPS